MFVPKFSSPRRGAVRMPRVIPRALPARLVAFLRVAACLLLCWGGLAAGQAAPLTAPPGHQQPILVLQYNGAIGPAAADYFLHGLHEARRRNAQLLVFELDTPGGLDSSMRDIIKAILNAPIPVATWVAPSGARAASAGTYILYASQIAAMAPASNLGAATPIAIGGLPGGTPAGKSPPGNADTERRKMVNDAAAYLRSLAQLHGRNAAFAESAVREAHSMSAKEALDAHVIDLIAARVDDLARALDGRVIRLNTGEVTLHTAGAPVIRVEPGWRTELLEVVGNPPVAALLMMAGIYGLFLELLHPGVALPGIVGAICLLLALYAFQMLPVDWSGVALIFLGCVLMVAELFLPTFGVVGLGGLVALVAGLLMLIRPEVPGFGISGGFIAALTLVTALMIFGVGGFALRARRRPVVSGREALIGAEGTVTAVSGGDAWAHVAGETWQVRSARDGGVLRPGVRVRVLAVEDLILRVIPIGDEN